MHPLWQLTQARLKEFFREPAAVFGLAFKNRPVERIQVDVRSDGPGGPAAAEAMKEALAADPRIQVTVGDAQTTRDRLRTAKTSLVVVPGSDPSAAGEYALDP